MGWSANRRRVGVEGWAARQQGPVGSGGRCVSLVPCSEVLTNQNSGHQHQQPARASNTTS